jgi:CxxC motif-containing protein (DUF1111 family)
VFDSTSTAFSNPATNLTAEEVTFFDFGAEGFDALFDADPTSDNPGLGPVFNNNGCASCHIDDGRGRPPLSGETLETMLFRVSVPGFGPGFGPKPASGFGTQLNVRSIAGVPAEARVEIAYIERPGQFGDGTPYSLREPKNLLRHPWTPFPANLLISPRTAPFLHGLGLLEAIPEATIRSLADPNDSDHDGISGRTNEVYNVRTGGLELGRFGWKANVGNIVQQVAAAYHGDMGVTNTLFPAEACEPYMNIPACARHASEVDDETVAAVVFYAQTLGVPARRNLKDGVAEQGEFLFHRAGCTSCHIPVMQTGVLAGVPAVSHQIIRPYTDLLLHDMGQALADSRPDFRANGREFRTAPLWGIGLVPVVNGHSNFLHDGRARSLTEAILWHGGEALNSREFFRTLPKAQRDAIVRFLESL